MLRFATSPTGDMCIDDLRLALLNSHIAQEKQEDFIIIMNDRNEKKNIENRDQEILALLTLFGIEYSQVIYQSQHIRFYSAMALQLMHEKKAFSCFCSPGWIAKKQEEAKIANVEYRYDDACRNLPAELVLDNTNPFTIRIIKPENDNFDSFMILHQDKRPADDFATAVDDMLSDISIIIQHEKESKAAQKQEYIRDALGYEKKIEYINLSQLDKDREWDVKGLLEAGYLPKAITNYLISINSDSPTFFDIERLKEINRTHLKGLDARELSRYVGFADAEIGELAKIYLKELSTTKELKAKIEPIFAPKEIPQAYAKVADLIQASIKKAPYFDGYENFKAYVIQESGIQEEDFETPLRLLLTNAEDGPEIQKIYKYLKNYIGEIIK